MQSKNYLTPSREIVLIGKDFSFMKLISSNLAKELDAIFKVQKSYTVTKRVNPSISLFIIDTRRDKKELFKLITSIKKGYGLKTKIAILGNQEEIDVKVRAFELGADEFINKPFDFREFSCRIKRLLNIYFADGGKSQDYTKITEGVFLDFNNCLLQVDGAKIRLSYAESLIIKYLGEKRFLTDKENIMDSLAQRMGLNNMTQNYFNVLICRLRKKIYSQSGRKLIKTRYGMGYELMG